MTSLSDRQIRKLMNPEPTGMQLVLIGAATVIAVPVVIASLMILVWHFFLPPQ